MSEKIADAKISLELAIENFQNYTIRSAALFTPERPFIEESVENVPFRKNLGQAIFKLAETEKMEESYRKVLSELRLLTKADINELESFIKTPKNQEILSRKFIASILEISRNNPGYKYENLLTKAVLSEIERLNTRIASFKNNQLERAKKLTH